MVFLMGFNFDPSFPIVVSLDFVCSIFAFGLPLNAFLLFLFSGKLILKPKSNCNSIPYICAPGTAAAACHYICISSYYVLSGAAACTGQLGEKACIHSSVSVVRVFLLLNIGILEKYYGYILRILSRSMQIY